MSANERHWLLSTLGWKKPLVRIAALRVRLSCTTRDRAWFTMHEWRVVSSPLPLCRNFVYSRLIFFFFFSLFFFPSRLLPTLIFFNQIRGRKCYSTLVPQIIDTSRYNEQDGYFDVSRYISRILKIFNRENIHSRWIHGDEKKRQNNEAIESLFLSLSLYDPIEIFDELFDGSR